MINFFKKLNAEWALRLSLGIMYLYSGIDIVLHPSSWTWAIRSLPSFANNIISDFGVERFLTIQGYSEIIMAVILLVKFVPRKIVKYVALFSAVEMMTITLFVGVDAVTFRDIGLIGSGFALFLML